MVLFLGCHNSVTGLKWSKYVPVVMHHRENGCSHLHNSLNIQPVLIHTLTDKFFAHCPLNPNPLVQQIGNYTLANLITCTKNINLKLLCIYCFN